MNGLEKITARIEADAEAEAERIAGEARTQCDAIRAEGEAKASEVRWRMLQDGVKAAEERARRLNKAADMEARKSILSTKQEIVAEAFQKTEDKISALTGELYVAFVAGYASRAAVTGREEVILNEADLAACGQKILDRANALLPGRGLPGSLTLSDRTGDFRGGLILRDGDVSVNCTIEALMDEARENLAAYAAAALFS